MQRFSTKQKLKNNNDGSKNEFKGGPERNGLDVWWDRAVFKHHAGVQGCERGIVAIGSFVWRVIGIENSFSHTLYIPCVPSCVAHWNQSSFLHLLWLVHTCNVEDHEWSKFVVLFSDRMLHITVDHCTCIYTSFPRVNPDCKNLLWSP